jgi:hypothetical protein
MHGRKKLELRNKSRKHMFFVVDIGLLVFSKGPGCSSGSGGRLPKPTSGAIFSSLAKSSLGEALSSKMLEMDCNFQATK